MQFITEASIVAVLDVSFVRIVQRNLGSVFHERNDFLIQLTLQVVLLADVAKPRN